MAKAFYKALGASLRARREAAGHSQEWMGDQLGVSFQMVQKYESGSCRISIDRLMKAAKALSFQLQAFLEEVDQA